MPGSILIFLGITIGGDPGSIVIIIRYEVATVFGVAFEQIPKPLK